MAYRIFGIARDEDNNPVVGATASLRRESDNVEVTSSTVTGADGSYGWLEENVLYPGPIKVRITALDGVVREISGRTTGQSGTIFVGDLHRAFRMMTDGVVDGVDGELAVSGSGVTLEVTVATGFAYLYGHPSYWADPSTVTIAANGTGNPRIDLIVVRLYPPGTANEGEQEIAVVQGTPAASPVAPGVTQDPNVVWEIALAEVTVAAGATAITGGNVADVRTYTSGPLMDSSVTTAKLADLAVTGAKIADETVTNAKLTAGVEVSTAEIAKVLKAPLVATDPPTYTQLALGELSNVAATGPTSGQYLSWNSTSNLWEPVSLTQVGIVVQEGDVTTVAQATIFDFDASDFAITESPTGEANISLAYGTAAGTPAEGNHTHTSAIEVRRANVVQVAAATMLNFGTQFVVSEAPASGNATIVANTGSTVNHLAAGNHVHEGYATLFAFLESDTARQVTSTLADVESVTIGPLADGVTYDIECEVDMRASLDSGSGYVVAYAKIASDSSVSGTQTGTTGGERTIRSFATKSGVVGDGVTSYTLYARAQMQGGGTDGSVSATTIIGRAYPRTVNVPS